MAGPTHFTRFSFDACVLVCEGWGVAWDGNPDTVGIFVGSAPCTLELISRDGL